MAFATKFSMILAGTAIVIMGANPASAITLNIGGTQVARQGYFSSVQGATTIDFESGAPTSGEAIYSAAPGYTPTVVNQSVVYQHAEPAGDTTSFLTIAPKGSTTPNGTPVEGATGPVTITFTKALDYFGLYWGSVDTYNSISFYSGGNLLKTFTGTDVSTTAKGSWTGISDNIFTNFFADAGQSFDKIVLNSTGIAFESDNHAYRVAQQTVPEPASLAGLLAIGTFGAGSLLKRNWAQKA